MKFIDIKKIIGIFDNVLINKVPKMKTESGLKVGDTVYIAWEHFLTGSIHAAETTVSEVILIERPSLNEDGVTHDDICRFNPVYGHSEISGLTISNRGRSDSKYVMSLEAPWPGHPCANLISIRNNKEELLNDVRDYLKEKFAKHSADIINIENSDLSAERLAREAEQERRRALAPPIGPAI